MPVYNVTQQFAGGSQGWTETHALNNSATDPELLVPLVQGACQKRANLLGNPFVITSFRISKYLENDGTRATRSVAFRKQQFVQSPQSGTGAAEPADVALIMRGTTTLGGRVNQTLLGAPSDEAVSAGGDVTPGVGGVGPNFNAYAGYLINNGFGWGTSQVNLDLGVTSIVQDVPTGRPIITIQFPRFVAPFPGEWFPARVRRVNNGRSPMNGQLIVQALTATTCQTREIIGLASAQIGGFIKLYEPTRPFTEYSGLVLQLVVGNHKRGRPPGSPRGRAPARVRG